MKVATLQAANWGSDDCVRLLLARSANPDAVDGLWRTPLMLAAMHAHRAHVVMQTLIDAGIYSRPVSIHPSLVFRAAAAVT